jgi:hypothetical protein
VLQYETCDPLHHDYWPWEMTPPVMYDAHSVGARLRSSMACSTSSVLTRHCVAHNLCVSKKRGVFLIKSPPGVKQPPAPTVLHPPGHRPSTWRKDHMEQDAFGIQNADVWRDSRVQINHLQLTPDLVNELRGVVASESTVFVMSSYSPQHLAHWLSNNVLPLYRMWRRYGASPHDDVITTNPQPMFDRWPFPLNNMPLNPDNYEETPRCWTRAVLGQERACTHSFCFTSPLEKAVMSEFRADAVAVGDKLLAQRTLAPAATPATELKVIMIQRNNTRRVLNSAALADTLVSAFATFKSNTTVSSRARRHYTAQTPVLHVLKLEHSTLAQQIDMFKDARILIGMHGNGQINMLWMDYSKRNHVFEYYSPQFWSPWFREIAEIVGITHHGMVCHTKLCDASRIPEQAAIVNPYGNKTDGETYKAWGTVADIDEVLPLILESVRDIQQADADAADLVADPLLPAATSRVNRPHFTVKQWLAAEDDSALEQCVDREYSQIKARIVILATDGDKDVAELKECLRSVYKYMTSCHQYSVVIFHENFSDALQADIAAASRNHVIFERVTLAAPADFDLSQPSPWNKRSKWGYMHMIRFFFKSVFDHPAVRDLDYYMRMDTDSRLTAPVTKDPFRLMMKRSLEYGYCKMTTDEYFVDGMWDAYDAYAKKEHHKPQAREFSSPATATARSKLPIFYNNFEIVHVPWYRSGKVQGWINHVDRSHKIYTHRWGDAGLRYLTALLFLTDTQAAQLPVTYTHQGQGCDATDVPTQRQFDV